MKEKTYKVTTSRKFSRTTRYYRAIKKTDASYSRQEESFACRIRVSPISSVIFTAKETKLVYTEIDHIIYDEYSSIQDEKPQSKWIKNIFATVLKIARIVVSFWLAC